MDRAVTAAGHGIRTGGPGVLELGGAAFEPAMRPAHRREFIDRVFSMPALHLLEMDLAAGRGRLSFAPGSGTPAALLRGLAKVMRAARPERFELADLGLVEALARGRPVTISRAGERLTFLHADHTGPDRCRFRHPALRERDAREAVLADLLGIAYIEDLRDLVFAGGIEARFDPARLSLETLVGLVETALTRTVASGPRYFRQPLEVRRRLIESNLVLAVISDFLLPPVRLLSIISLWLLNARHVRPGGRALREFRANLHLLYGAIATVTLLSLSFIASGVMYWMLEFWPRRVKALRAAEGNKFLAQLKRSPCRTWVDRGGMEMEVELDHVRLGETVILREGDVAPGDGVMLAGEVIIAETWAGSPHRKRPGDVIHGSGRVIRGEARMRLDSLGSGAVAGQLAGWHRQALETPVSDERAKRVAENAVFPALALGVLALLRGGISMTKAVIRSDYFTGPVVARELGWVAAVIAAAKSGLLIRRDTALEQLAECDCFVLGPGIAWRDGRRNSEEFIEGLRSLGVEQVLAAAGADNGERAIVLRADAIGAVEFHGAETGGMIKERRHLGRRVAFIGDCATHAAAASQADIAVHVCRPPFDNLPPADLALLDPTLEGVLALRGIAMDFNGRIRASFATAMIPNAACVLGAFYFGLPVLGVVALTNAGTFTSYLEAARAIRNARTGARDSS